jgi:hypothetical protein
VTRYDPATPTVPAAAARSASRCSITLNMIHIGVTVT